jgi:alkanesulfonate monooxygenase SsuD/methylene tetrahydromethanopterin reductase-like flavin-dependent oxidoreductase (luciferase family)
MVGIAAMELGLIYEIPVPRPWTDRSEYAAYHDVVAQAVLADGLGYHSIWSTEHHFLDEFSHSSAPEVLYAYIAARTSNLRLGHGVRLLPFPYNHPVRSAEQAAALDILSDGRLEFGTGRSATRAELEGFGIDPGRTRQLADEALEVIVGAWTNDEFEWHGESFDLPRRRVVPKPIQAPHPPIWQASTSIDGHKSVGERGLGLLSFTVAHPIDGLAERLDLYRDGLKHATPVGRAVNDRAGVFTLVHCAETTQQAYDEAGDAFLWYAEQSFAKFASLVSWQEGRDLGTYDYLKTLLDVDFTEVTLDLLVDIGAVVIGDPEECLRLARQYRDAGTDLLLCNVNPYNIPHEQVMRSISLLGEHVLPEMR